MYTDTIFNSIDQTPRTCLIFMTMSNYVYNTLNIGNVFKIILDFTIICSLTHKYLVFTYHNYKRFFSSSTALKIHYFANILR